MRKNRGFTLIELMIVVAIIALLAAIALPAYQDYVARTQVVEGYSLASDARTAVATYYADRQNFPTDNEGAGLADPDSIVGRYVSRVVLQSNGLIEVEFGNNASAKILGEKLSLTMVDDGGSLRWTCSGIDSRYLPSACR